MPNGNYADFMKCQVGYYDYGRAEVCDVLSFAKVSMLPTEPPRSCAPYLSCKRRVQSYTPD
jgi:hypothetical protein